MRGLLGRLPLAALLAVTGVSGASAVGVGVANAGPQRHVSVEALAKRLSRWVAANDRAAHERAVKRVQQGVPPAALAAFLAAARNHPDALYTPIITNAARYRNTSVRGQALAALAAQSPGDAQTAIARAADDHDRTIRRLAYALSKLHPSPASHEVVVAMLERDPELAEEIAAAEAPPPDDSDLDDEIVMLDDDSSDDSDAPTPSESAP